MLLLILKQVDIKKEVEEDMVLFVWIVSDEGREGR